MVPSLLSLVPVLLLLNHRLVQGTSTVLKLLTEEENQLTQRTVEFEAWCQEEMNQQERQRKELSVLRASLDGQDIGEESDAAFVDAMQLQLIQGGEITEADHPELDLTVKCLSELESELAGRPSAGWVFSSGARDLEAVKKVLHDAEKKLSFNQQPRPSLASSKRPEVEQLKARQLKAVEASAINQARALAARSGRQVLDAALSQANAAVSDAAGICGLGRSVLNRTETLGKTLVMQALELIGKAEGAAEAEPKSFTGRSAKPAQSAGIKPHEGPGGSARLPADATTGLSAAQLAQLLDVSQKLQRQQAQMEEQIADLKQVQIKAASQEKEGTPEPSLAESLPEIPDLHTVDPPARGSARQKHAKASLSLAAEAAAEQKSDSTFAAMPTDMPTASKSRTAVHVHSAGKAHDKSQDAVNDVKVAPRMDVPKDFPAALRGGWQGLLAKKRAEKKRVKPDDSLGIMELMQTPQTYTAWQPDQGNPPSKAKDDFLAAEKALDEDDEVPNKKKAKSFLQLDHGASEFGGADPLAFFQFRTDSQRPALSAPPAQANVVAMLIQKFAMATNNTLLVELSQEQIRKEDLQALLQRLETEPMDGNEDSNIQKMCESYQKEKEKSSAEEFSREIRRHYAMTKVVEERKVLQREVAAREHLAFAFGNTSRRLLAAKLSVQRGGAADRETLQQIQREVDKLGGIHVSSELQAVLTSFSGLFQQEEDELADAIASAASRQQQTESHAQQELFELKARVAKLERVAEKTMPASLNAQKLEHICAAAMEGIKARRTQRDVQLEALRSALALITQLT
mmetsp:Transcript_49858/g.112139  ORF Transcript_49858/g.112139 Transcript_49858/m.112139 type:complete len:801 (+) Transcript_49858:56-2458(+)